MSSSLFMGVKITPDSHPHDELPGIWLPLARLQIAATGQALEDVRDKQPCDSQADADARALRVAIRRIREGLHQG
ncbi:hypothetical protein GCM10027082_22170 [Comamonas humi]